jgi:MFS family permease
VTVRRASFFLLPIIYLGFISLGLPDGTLGVAWPAIYPELRLPIGLAGTITIVITLLSGVSGFSSGPIVARFRTGPVVLASCLFTGGALLLISRAAGLGWMLAAAVPLGLGAGAVDAALNGFVARHYSGRHMNWLHACWGIGATCGPLFMGWAIGGGHGWRAGYLTIGLAQVSLALLFLLTLPLWATVPERAAAASLDGQAGPPPTAGANSFAGWLSPLIFALYVAVEMTAGLWAGSILIVGRHFTAGTAALCTACFYGSITGGRILVGLVVERWGNRRLAPLGGAVALAGAVLFAFATVTPAAAAALVLLGLGFAPVYPCLMHEVPRRFAPEAVQTLIGRQSGAANLGAAILPAAAGWIAEYSLEGIPWMIVAGIVGLIALIRWLNRLT